MEYAGYQAVFIAMAIRVWDECECSGEPQIMFHVFGWFLVPCCASGIRMVMLVLPFAASRGSVSWYVSCTVCIRVVIKS